MAAIMTRGTGIEVEISEEPGKGANLMHTFIQEHIVQTLQPFTDHVDELRKAVDQLASDLSDTDEKANRNSVRLGEQEKTHQRSQS